VAKSASSTGDAFLAAGSLGLGLAGVSLVFSIAAAFLFSALPYSDADRVVFVRPHQSWELFQRLQSDNVVFEAIAAYTERAANPSDVGEPGQLLVGRVTKDFLDVAGVGPILAALGHEPRREALVIWLRIRGSIVFLPILVTRLLPRASC
jgi:hypothetical protein